MHKSSLGEHLSVLNETKFGVASFWPLGKEAEPFMHAEQLWEQHSAGKECSTGLPHGYSCTLEAMKAQICQLKDRYDHYLIIWTPV